MTVSYDYKMNSPLIFTYTYPTTVATASSSVPVATFVVPVDCYLDQVSMTVSVNGTVSGATEIMLSNNAVSTGDMWSANGLQIANDSAALYATIDRSAPFTTIGLAKIDAGDRLLLCVTEIPGGTDSSALAVTIVCAVA